MGLADFFNLSRFGQGPDSMTDLGAGAPGGIAGALGADQPIATQQASDGAPQINAPQPGGPVMQSSTQPYTPPDDGGGVGGFLSRMLAKAQTRDPDTQMNFWDRLGQFGANMTDLAGDTQGAGAAYRGQMQQRQTQAQRAQLNQMAKALGLTGKEALAFQIDPEKWAAANVQDKPDPGEKVISNEHGVFAYDPETKTLRSLQGFPQKTTAPPGYHDNGDGTYTFVKGGPADPDVVSALAGVRRKAVTANPMPSRARAGVGGWQPPNGFKVLHLPGS